MGEGGGWTGEGVWVWVVFGWDRVCPAVGDGSGGYGSSSRIGGGVAEGSGAIDDSPAKGADGTGWGTGGGGGAGVRRGWRHSMIWV